MKPSCIDILIKALFELEERDSLSPLADKVKDDMKILNKELEFLQFYIRLLGKWNEAWIYQNNDLGLLRISQIKTASKTARRRFYVAAVDGLYTGEFQSWNMAVPEFLDAVDACKLEIKQNCLHLMDDSSDIRFSGRQLHQFLKCVCTSLGNLIPLKSSDHCRVVSDVEKLIQSLKKKSDLLENVFVFAERCFCTRKHFNALRIHVQSWAYKAACVSILFWAAGLKDEEALRRLSLTIPNLLLCTPEDIRVYLGVFKASRPSYSDRMLMGELISNLVDFLVEENRLGGLPPSGAQVLRAGIVFLIIFCSDSEEQDSLTQLADGAINGFISYVCSIGSEGNFQDLLDNIQNVKTTVRRSHVQVKESAQVNFPTINLMGVIDFMIDYWKDVLDCKKYLVPFAMNQFQIVNEQLLSLKALMEKSHELQNEYVDIKDLWIRIANVTDQTKHALNSFFCSRNPLWWGLIRLSDAVDEIELIKSELMINLDRRLQSPGVSRPKSSQHVQDKGSRLNDIVVGFEHRVDDIVNLLKAGSELCIVSISGMPGVGKSTLAKEVYKKFAHHFPRHAWCTVSEAFSSQKMLRDVLNAIALPGDDISNVAEGDLAQRVYQWLCQCPYFIVFDDIWEIIAWDEIRASFPNDKNGSKIVFTSRNRNLASSQANLRCIPYDLEPLSPKQSWELLRQKLPLKHALCSRFTDFGEQIAKGCNGIPLAIVVIAGLLIEKLEDLGWWEQIADSIGEYVSNEDCKEIIALSYKYLPDPLKPCFLYFAAFPEDKTIRIKKLTQLWISEGFVQKQGKTRQEDMAIYYLKGLEARSLVTVVSRSSDGSIKTCCMHDLLYRFCLGKIGEECFIQVVLGNAVSRKSWLPLFNHYRMSIQAKDWRSIFSSAPSVSGLQSLVFFSNCTSDPYKWNSSFPLHNFKRLEVFDLEDVKLDSQFLEEIMQLHFLRYLAVQCTTKSVPDEIGNLEYLEVLRIKGNENEILLPTRFWCDLKRLRHVDVGRGVAATNLDDSQLEHVQTFSSLSLSCGEDAEKILRRITGVRKLRCQFNEYWKRDMKQNQLPKLECLTNLEALNVSYVGKVLRRCEFMFPSTLKKLTLSNFRLPWTYVSVIGKLEHLEVLKLLDNAFSGEKWDTKSEEFLKLKSLKLCKLNIAEWTATDGSFPLLQQLVVQHCSNLHGLPCIFGESSTLKMIHVHWCSPGAESSASWILQEQLDNSRKDIEVQVIENQLDADFSISEFWDL